ncbi:hypothetical protein CLPU_5c00730 [Gottschalkia purinilytica]|uniref:tRNA(Met) cytidine acetate ligase n=1 Tax=Gottschalkia purinilytica TaxID=1503 RepID=A0A0L0WBA3_GOTPU|nr:nucleotidyltransferase [Gottschalkia purinilytica]KNF08766.1 hypothetical protein CLPU_5c00730 [Gottschalkia purinilytica]
MKILGLVTEYNPFHNGHLYHLLESKKITNSDYSVCIMSGNFLQRGEPALLDKWSRAKMAIDNGVDLVIELPFIYSCQSAEYFSYGAIKILDSLGIVDSICFGSEYGSIDSLGLIADVLIEEPDDYKEYLKKYLNEGNSYPKSRSSALYDFFKTQKLNDHLYLKELLSSPNNILGIEYMKALKKINSNIIPYTIKRISSNYHDKEIKGNISSATAIREEFFKNNALDNIKDTVPIETYNYLIDFLKDYKSFNSIENFNQILLYILRTMSHEDLSNYKEVEKGLENRILKCFSQSNDISNILNCIMTKRYTLTRLKRILFHILLNLDKNMFDYLNSFGPQYARVLGANRKGLEILSTAKNTSSIPIITKFSNYKKYKNNVLSKMIELDKKATDIYFMGLSGLTDVSSYNLDYYISPYFKK